MTGETNQVSVLVSLGSNLGDRRGFLQGAIQRLLAIPGLSDAKTSRIWQTPAQGGPSGQGDFLNAVARFRLEGMTSSGLLERLLHFENLTGRVRTTKNGPRTLDLDLLLFGDEVCSMAGLTVPHPHMHERPFVLIPAAEVAGDMVHPTIGRTIDELRRSIGGGDTFNVMEEANWHHAVTHT